MNKYMNERLNDRVNERMNKRMNERMNKRVNERMNKHMNKLSEKCTQAGVFILTLVLLLSFMPPIRVLAMTYRDVPSTHYAYAAVDWVSDPDNGSFMVGDASNNFNPTRTLDKFETAKIFAMAAGYKYATNAISAAEQEIYDKSYETHKAFLDSLATQYAKWLKTADREIAYLMYKGILTSNDVSTFVSKTNGTEAVNNLTKQEAILFIIRLDGKQSNAEAITLPYHTPFKDDALITADLKKYIYYAKEAGLAAGSDGYINPTRAVSRAEMAQLFYNMFAGRPKDTDTEDKDTATTTTLTGVIDSVYLDTHVYITANNLPKIYKLAANAVIVIDNVQKTAAFLAKGMSVTVLLNANNEIVTLAARTATESEPTTPATTPTTPATLSEHEGYVVAVSAANSSNGNTNALTIRTQRVKLTGEIVTDEKTYTLAANCTLRRGTAVVAFSDIKINDIVLFKYSGTVLYEVNLQEKDRTILGTLIEKKYVGLTATPVMVIEDAQGVKYDLRVTDATYFTRGSSRNLTWNDIRIGDDVEAECEYDKLITVYAEGVRTTLNGTLEEIRITGQTQQITITKSDKTTAVYTISANDFDVYDLRIGMGLKLYLDSWEVYDVAITAYPSSTSTAIVGTIQSLRSGNTIVVADSDQANATTYTIRIDASTIDTATSASLSFTKLRVGMNVYVVLNTSNTALAKSITILP